MKNMIPIWFFVGGLLFLYGALILLAGIQDYFIPAEAQGIAMAGMHLQIWWGLALLILGGVYLARFWPKRGRHR